MARRKGRKRGKKHGGRKRKTRAKKRSGAFRGGRIDYVPCRRSNGRFASKGSCGR